MINYLHLIDTRTTGPRCDVTPLFADAEAFAWLVATLSAPFAGQPFEAVAGIDALGFILGSAMALHLHKGFIPLRKGGKLPVATHQARFVDYSGTEKALELRQDALRGGERILLVDEWIETGAQMAAAAQLIERVGGQVAGIAAINIDRNALPLELAQRYPCYALWYNMQDADG